MFSIDGIDPQGAGKSARAAIVGDNLGFVVRAGNASGWNLTRKPAGSTATLGVSNSTAALITDLPGKYSITVTLTTSDARSFDVIAWPSGVLTWAPLKNSGGNTKDEAWVRNALDALATSSSAASIVTSIEASAAAPFGLAGVSLPQGA